MNYIELINHFWKIDDGVQFTGWETKLYFYLVKTANGLGWVNEFWHADGKTAVNVGMSLNTMKTSRNRLKQFELIDFKEGGNGYGDKTRYQILTPKPQPNLSPKVVPKVTSNLPPNKTSYQILTSKLQPNLLPNVEPKLQPNLLPSNKLNKTETKQNDDDDYNQPTSNFNFLKDDSKKTELFPLDKRNYFVVAGEIQKSNVVDWYFQHHQPTYEALLTQLNISQYDDHIKKKLREKFIDGYAFNDFCHVVNSIQKHIRELATIIHPPQPKLVR